MDAVWLMGVWERSPAGLAMANANAGLHGVVPGGAARPGSTPTSSGRRTACGGYVADAAFGGPDGLAAARAALAARGVRLVLDYVPNHVAPDHPWVTATRSSSCAATNATSG